MKFVLKLALHNAFTEISELTCSNFRLELFLDPIILCNSSI